MNEKNIKDISIHKSNAMIRGGNSYTLNAQRLGNGIYNYVQKNSYYKKELFKIKIQDIREIMNLENTNSYVGVVKKALTELSTPFVLYNPQDLTPFHTSGQEVLWKSVQFLTDASIVKEDKNIYITGKLTDSVRVLIANANDGNFTPLLLNGELKNIKSKHSHVLYEYISSYNKHPQYKNKVELKQKRLDMMFNLKESKKYKYFSSFLPILERCIIDINNNTDMYLKLAVDKKLKIYIIYRIREYRKKENIDTIFLQNTPLKHEEESDIFSHPNGLFKT